MRRRYAFFTCNPYDADFENDSKARQDGDEGSALANNTRNTTHTRKDDPHHENSLPLCYFVSPSSSSITPLAVDTHFATGVE
jgi:hypothetical protein